MKTTFVMIILVGLAAGLLRPGPKPRAWGKSITWASKAGKLGELSLKSTLSMLTMAGVMALFTSIETALAPDDLVGKQWIAAQKAEYLKEMGELNWYRKLWTILGAIICLMIITVGGSLGLWGSRRKRVDMVQERDLEKEMTMMRVIERDVKEKEMIQFGEVDLELVKKEAVVND